MEQYYQAEAAAHSETQDAIAWPAYLAKLCRVLSGLEGIEETGVLC
jgi:hypothetical protein